MKYSLYTTEDFIQDDSFIAWVRHGEQDKFWKTFLIKYPEKNAEVKQAQLLILATVTQPKGQLGEAQKQDLWDAIKAQIQAKSSPSEPLSQPRRVLLKPWAIASTLLAACLIVVLLLGLNETALLKLFPLHHQVSGLVYRSNAKTSPQAIELPDGSSIILQPQASISYSVVNFSKQQRNVYLEGEAFFEVKKNAKVPFTVHAHGLIAKVLGTSFTISARKNQSLVDVNVKTGRVSVFTETDADVKLKLKGSSLRGNILRANEHISLSKTDQSWSAIVKKPYASVQSHSTSFQFNDIPAAQALDSLAAAYGLKFIYNRKQLANCKITAYLTDQPLSEKLDLLCQVLESSYKLSENRVEIFSKGCP